MAKKNTAKAEATEKDELEQGPVIVHTDQDQGEASLVNIDRNTARIGKIVFRGDGGLDVTFKVPITVPGDGQRTEQFTIPNPNPKHPDMKRVIEGLYIHMLRLSGSAGPLYQATEKVMRNSKAGERWLDSMLGRVTCKSVTFAGTPDTPKVQIQGHAKEMTNNQKVDCAAPLMTLKTNNYPFTGELEHCLSALIAEAEAYVFDKKYAQLTLDDMVDKGDQEGPDEGEPQVEV